MGSYFVRRIALLIPTMILVTMILFMALRLMPGNVIELMVQQHTQEQAGEMQLDVALIKKMMGLDKPIHVQYYDWIKGIVTKGDLGHSLWTDRTLFQEMKARLPVTIELSVLAMIITNLIGIPLGIYTGIRQDTWIDYIGRSLSILALATPGFWLATILIVYGSIYLHWAPQIEYIHLTVDPIGNLSMLMIPALIMGLSGTGGMIRYLRTFMLETLRQDYVRTAWAKGLKERVVVVRHAIRNAAIPLITIFAPTITGFISGSVIMEQIFVLPGMGRLLLENLTRRDYLMVSGVNLLYGSIGMFQILFEDFLYTVVDPRVKYR